MAISVIGAGFGRTGTMSIKIALEQLGFGPCHHMEEVFQDPAQLPGWQAAAAGQAVDWDAVLKGYGSTIDWPSAHYWRELAAFYPDAKVILSVRPAERWWHSFSGTIQKALALSDQVDDPHIAGILKMANQIVTEQTFAGAMADKDTALAAFEKRIADVRAAIADVRLLVFDVSEGWAPICRFLDRPEPEGAFPRSNAYDEFWQKFGAGQEH